VWCRTRTIRRQPCPGGLSAHAGKKEQKEIDDSSTGLDGPVRAKERHHALPGDERGERLAAGRRGLHRRDGARHAGTLHDRSAAIVSHGMGVGADGLYLGFNNRDLFGRGRDRAVASHPRDNVKEQRLAFFLVGGELDPSSITSQERGRLIDMTTSTFRKISNRGANTCCRAAARNGRWIDTLDKREEPGRWSALDHSAALESPPDCRRKDAGSTVEKTCGYLCFRGGKECQMPEKNSLTNRSWSGSSIS